MSYIEKLKAMGACPEALAWLRRGKYRSLQAAWKVCPEPRWLLWLLGRTARTDADRRRIVACAATFARSVLPLVPAGEERPRLAVELAERYAAGDAISADAWVDADAAWVDAACFAAYYTSAAHAHASASAAYASAAYASAARAASATRAATRAAPSVWVADSASAASAAASSAAWAATADQGQKLAELADLVRTIVPRAPRLGVKP